jgi:hypothetical protein
MDTPQKFEEGEMVWMYYKDEQNVTQCKPVMFLGENVYQMNQYGGSLIARNSAVLDGETIIDVPTEHLEKITDITSELPT